MFDRLLSPEAREYYAGGFMAQRNGLPCRVVSKKMPDGRCLTRQQFDAELRALNTSELLDVALHADWAAYRHEFAAALIERLADYATAVDGARAIISKSPSRAAAILQQLK